MHQELIVILVESTRKSARQIVHVIVIVSASYKPRKRHKSNRKATSGRRFRNQKPQSINLNAGTHYV